jgi:HK97 family phage prohead protease
MGSDDLINLKQETRATLKDGPGFSGYAITFNALSVDLGGFREIILPEAVNRTVQQGADLRALWNHNSDIVLGRMSAGTLGIVKDQNGLKAEYVIPASAGREYEAVERGDVSGQSFGFRAYDDEWSFDGALPTRYVKDMLVSEVSATGFPAYPTTSLRVGRPRENRVEWLRMKHKTLMARG